MRKIQYHKNDNIWCYIIEGIRCQLCDANVFHKEYNGKDIEYHCNACNCLIGTLKPEYIEEDLDIGVWK